MQPGTMKPGDRKELGARGEALVAHWLTEHGYEILFRNFLCRYGELDIVARKQEVIAFVEVKSRLARYFSLSEVITPSKQRKMIQAAKWFISVSKLDDVVYRFDVALVEEGVENHSVGNPTIEYIEQAFTTELYG